MEKEKTILFYDGYCLMCSSLVQWVMKRDKNSSIFFAALQDEEFSDFLKKAPTHIREADSVILYHKGKLSHYSEAIFKLYSILGYPWKLMNVLRIFPLFIRDRVYRFIAKNRTKWFGSTDVCYMVPPEKRGSFLTDPTRKFSDSDKS